MENINLYTGYIKAKKRKNDKNILKNNKLVII